MQVTKRTCIVAALKCTKIWRQGSTRTHWELGSLAGYRGGKREEKRRKGRSKVGRKGKGGKRREGRETRELRSQ